MRELVFALEYEPGCNLVADTLAEYPDARIRSLSLHATSESLWRVDHVAGSPAALADLGDAFLATDYYTDCLTPDHCGATQRTQVLESTDETLVVYSYWERTSDCASVPHMALERLGDGALFETSKEERRYTWRIVHSGEGDVRAFFDDLEESVDDCVDIDFQRLMNASAGRDVHRGERTLSNRRRRCRPPLNTDTTRVHERSTWANSPITLMCRGRRSITDSAAPRNTSRNSESRRCSPVSGHRPLANRQPTRHPL